MEHILEYEDFLADKGLVLEASKKDAKVLDKLIDTNLKNSQEMKKVVGQWKKAEGQEKADLTSKLKELTLVKQDLEKKIAAEVEELDKGIGLEVVTEATHEFNGKMLRNMEVGGAGVGPFASTPRVKLKKGQKVKLIIQTGGSMGDNYQFWDPKTGKKLGNKWDHQLPDKITNIVDY